MRRTVLAGVLDVAASNLRHATTVRLFELGPVYLPQPSQKLPLEVRRLAVVMTGQQGAEFWGNGTGGKAALEFFDLKGRG